MASSDSEIVVWLLLFIFCLPFALIALLIKLFKMTVADVKPAPTSQTPARSEKEAGRALATALRGAADAKLVTSAKLADPWEDDNDDDDDDDDFDDEDDDDDIDDDDEDEDEDFEEDDFEENDSDPTDDMDLLDKLAVTWAAYRAVDRFLDGPPKKKKDDKHDFEGL